MSDAGLAGACERGEAMGSGPTGRPVAADARGLRHAVQAESPLAEGRVIRGPSLSAKLRRQAFDLMVEELKASYHISIRKWRRHMSGVAYELKYRDGRIRRLITAPRPRSNVSAAIFLHEVGHHAVGFRKYKPRCLEEYFVWQWAFREMTRRSINVDERVLRHYRRSMYHYVRLARKRGIKELPGQLEQFLNWPG